MNAAMEYRGRVSRSNTTAVGDAIIKTLLCTMQTNTPLTHQQRHPRPKLGPAPISGNVSHFSLSHMFIARLKNHPHSSNETCGQSSRPCRKHNTHLYLAFQPLHRFSLARPVSAWPGVLWETLSDVKIPSYAFLKTASIGHFSILHSIWQFIKYQQDSSGYYRCNCR